MVYTWRRAGREAGATLRTVAAPETAGSRAEAWNAALLDAIDERTAVVAIPELHWTDGLRFDLDAVGPRARADAPLNAFLWIISHLLATRDVEARLDQADAAIVDTRTDGEYCAPAAR